VVRGGHVRGTCVSPFQELVRVFQLEFKSKLICQWTKDVGNNAGLTHRYVNGHWIRIRYTAT